MTIQGLRRCVAWGLLATTSALTLSAVSAQTKVKPGFNLFSAEQDVEIGRQSAAEAERQLPILRDPRSRPTSTRSASASRRSFPGPKFPYQFKVVNASDINAFALPGGYMYLNRGLIEAAKNEGQLAGVMAHEMAHVALRHGTNQASKAYLGQAGLGSLGGLLGKDDGSTNQMIGAVGGFGLNALFLKFSRTDEEQADIVGAQTMAKAGYDPQDMVGFLRSAASQAGARSGQGRAVLQQPSGPPEPCRPNPERDEDADDPSDRSRSAVSQQAKTKLAAMPAARSMQQIAQNQPPLRSRERYTEAARSGDMRIEAPSSTFRTFEQRDGLFRHRVSVELAQSTSPPTAWA